MFCKYGKEAKTPQPGWVPPPLRPSPVVHLRPCLVDGKPATFHRWVDEDQALLQIHPFVRLADQQKIAQRFREEGTTDGTATIEKLRATFALVEYPDGSVGKVKPELIQFMDREV